MLRTIHLHGRLGRLFGKRHRLDVASPAEAIRALSALYPKFAERLRKGSYQVRVGDIPIDAGALTLSPGREKNIHITPAGALAGIETILIIGLGLIAAATVAVTLLAMPKTPKAMDREDQNNQSAIFGGPVNVAEQGHCVPLVYGKMRSGSVVGSAGIATTDINAVGVDADPGSVGYTPGVKGGIFGDEWNVNLLKGGKGGKGGSSRAAQEDPNTLQSQATARILDIVSEGEIVGLVDGLKSVYFDETPVQNPDGSFNFAGVSIEERLGLPDQLPMPGFTRTENTYSVDTEVKVSTGPVTRRLANDDADVCRVTIGLPRLFKQDTTNGDLKQHSVAIAIDYQSNDGGFTQVLTHEFRGKTNNEYQRSFDIRLTGPGPHDIRVRRLSPDSALASIEDKTFLDMLTEIVEAKLIYPDTAMYGISVDARQFGTNIPTRSYEIYGMIVEVPTNYDPETRAYTGIWDGTFKREWTDNPAWVYRDIVVNKRYGLGRRIPPTALDKWSLYSISQYCDGMVPDGQGGEQPRYTINCVLNSDQAAYDVLASMASAFRGWTYWGSGAIVPEQDRPADPAMIITPSNVVDGKINYDRVTPLEKRRSVVIMYWNDPDDGYRLVPEIAERPDLIRRFGWKPGDELTAFGCTNRAEARRKALFVFEDEDSGNRSASYAVGDDHAFMNPAAITVIADPRYAAQRRGGRVKAATVNTITLDAPVVLDTADFVLRVVMPDGSVETRPVLNAPGAHSVITLGGDPYAPLPIVGAVWALESDEIANRQFRIRSIQLDEAPYAVRALSHDPNKYDRVELGRDLPEVNYLAPIAGPLPTPDNIEIEEFLLRDGNSASPALRMSWTIAQDPRITIFQAQYRRPGDGWSILSDGLELGRDIRNSEPGVWGFRVRALDALGRRTAWAEKTQTISAATDTLPNVTGLSIVVDDIALTSVLNWTNPDDVRPLRRRILRNSVNNLGTAVSLGETDQNEFAITETGHYWVQTVFMDEASPTPPRVEATAAQMPNPQWDRVDDRPMDLGDLDLGASLNLNQAMDDIDELFLVFGDTETASEAMAAAIAAAEDAEGYAATTLTYRDTTSGYMSAAQASAVTARLIAASTIPGTFDADGTHFFLGYEGDPATLTPMVATATHTFPAVSGIGKVLQVAIPSGSGSDVSNIGVIQVQPGRTYRATVRHRTLSGTRNLQIFLLGLGASHVYVPVIGNVATPTSTTTWTSTSVTLSGDDMLAAGAVYVRALFRVDTGTDETVQASIVRVEDVTESTLAGIQATAASASSATATAAASTATTQANLSATYAASAGKSAGATFPSDFSDPSQWVDYAWYGGVVNFTGGQALWTNQASIRSTWKMVIDPAKIYRFFVRYKMTTNGGSNANRCYVGGYGWNSAGGAVGIVGWAAGDVAYLSSLGTVVTVSANMTGAALIAFGYHSMSAVALVGYSDPGSAGEFIECGIEDVSESVASASSASISTIQAVIATNAASAAQSSATLSASLGPGLITPNPDFVDYPNSGFGNFPTGWLVWDGPDAFQRVAGLNNKPYSLEIDCTTDKGAAGLVNYFDGVRGLDYVVVEMDATLVSGSLEGLGSLFRFYDGDNNYVSGTEIDYHVPTLKDVTGEVPYWDGINQRGVAGRLYRWRFLVRLPNNSNIRRVGLYVVGDQYFSGYFSKKIHVHHYGIRPATQAEIRDQTVLAPLEATVTTQAGAIATIQGAAAYWETVVAAGGGFPAMVRLKAGSGGSAIDLAASRLSVYNPSNTGEYQEIARFEGGIARLNNALIRNLQVAPRADSEIFFPVQLRPKVYVGTDGQTIQYDAGKTLGAIPERIVPDLIGIPVASGEALDVKAVSVSATQFTVYAKKIVPGSPTVQNTGAGSAVGGTPLYQVHKPTSDDAYNGYYTFAFDMSLTLISEEPDFGGMVFAAYNGTVNFYANSGSGFVLIASEEYYRSEYIAGPAPSSMTYYDETYTLNYPSAIGQHGGYEFGIHPGAGAFGVILDNVSYSTQTSSSTTALANAVPFYVYPSS